MTVRNSYWKESVEDALCEAGIEADPAQVDDVLQSILVSIENESMATGRDAIPNPMLAEVERVRTVGNDNLKHVEQSAAREISELTATISRLLYRINELESEARNAR